MTDLLDAARRVVESSYEINPDPVSGQHHPCPPDREAIDDLEAALDAYEWSDEPPTEDGVYYYRDSAMSASVCRVQTDGIGDGHAKFFVGSPYAFHELPGQWAGPIPEPTDPE